MLSSEERQTILATACVAFLIFVAFSLAHIQDTYSNQKRADE
jgi:hypothetical protein